jgi:hypothetical protein
MQHSNSEADSRSFEKKLHAFYGNYDLHQILPLDPILNQFNPVHALMPSFFNLHSEIIHSFTSIFSKEFLPFSFFD